MVIIGMADVQVATARKVAASLLVEDERVCFALLLPPFETYHARREKRDHEQPHKAGQDGDRVYHGFSAAKDQFDLVITDSPSSIALRGRMSVDILCLFGPPGVGKSTLADVDLEHANGDMRVFALTFNILNVMQVAK